METRRCCFEGDQNICFARGSHDFSHVAYNIIRMDAADEYYVLQDERKELC